MNLNFFANLNIRKKIIIISFLLPLAILIITIFIIYPTVNDINKMKSDIETQLIDLEVKYQKGQNLKKLMENLEIIEPKLESLNKIYINSDKVLEFITSLEEVSSNNNITQKINLSTANSIEENNYKKIPLQIYTMGKFNDQLKYLSSLESLNYYINIKNMEISAQSSANNQEIDNGNINLIFFADTFWK